MSPLQVEVRERFGLLPNFFDLAPETPEITANLWGMARFAYLDNPLPSLFKERLFVYVSRFCQVRYCIVRHVGFLVGLGRPSGDAQCPPETIEQVVRLIGRPLPRGDALEPHHALLETGAAQGLPESGTSAEESVFACATHVFLQTPQAARCLDALRRAVGESALQHLVLFLTFVRAAHYWTRVHPELAFEDDVKEMLVIHAALADGLLNDPEAAACDTAHVVLDELHSLRRELALREEVERARIEGARAEARATEMADASRRKTEFLAMLAHELRNPLAPIRTGLQIMRLTGTGGDAYGSAADMLERQVAQMVRLIDDLLDVSRIDRGQVELRRQPVELGSVIHHAAEANRPLCTSMRHELTTRLPDGPVYLDADPARLAQVVGNLLNNACKFTPPGGHIELECARRGGFVDIRVRDDGDGITADELPRVFELFMQADRERSHGGLGVGLSLVKNLVEMHGGTVEARSEGRDRGSEFTVRLPVLLQPQPSPQSEPTGRRAAPRRILVVDDNRDSAASLATLLEMHGHEVHIAHDGQQAVEAAARLQPEVVLLDIGLPALNGYETARRIREQRGSDGVLLVAVTGWGQDEARRLSHEAGFDAHLVKPVTLDAITNLLPDAGSLRTAG
jgi:signal transduction histidine kinase/CheY-like chemotaxis protein